jgi:hypothetical protein
MKICMKKLIYFVPLNKLSNTPPFYYSLCGPLYMVGKYSNEWHPQLSNCYFLTIVELIHMALKLPVCVKKFVN